MDGYGLGALMLLPVAALFVLGALFQLPILALPALILWGAGLYVAFPRS